MATAPQVFDGVLKEFNYRFEVNGLQIAVVQEVDHGDTKIEKSERAGGGSNFNIQEAGRLTFGEVKLKGVVALDGTSKSYWYDWQCLAQDPNTGTGSRPSTYKRNFSIYQLGPDGNPVRVWEFTGGWVSEYKQSNQKSTENKNDLIEDVTICYDYKTLRAI